MTRHATLWALAAVAVGFVGAANAAPRATPLTFVWPTGVEVERSGTLLVVENGTRRIERVDPLTGRHAIVATIDHAYRTTGAGARVFVSANDSVWRVGLNGADRKVADASEAGPIASAPNGDVYFTADGGVYRLAGGAGPARRLPATASLQGSHGIAVDGDSTLLVSDTEHDRVVRIALPGGAVTTLARVASPRGIAVARDGSVYVVAAAAKRVLHLDAHGSKLGYVGARFGDPYDLALGADGTIYVVDTAQIGTVKRIAPDGTTSTIGSG
jgi:sugar lactone lactonase YvrE